jgi:membrane protease YdiL (CAAX protease family)
MIIIRRMAWFLLFVAFGLLVFFVFSHYYPLFPDSADIVGRFMLGALLLGLALLARQTERFRGYWLLPFAFFTALTAISIDHYLSLSRWILPRLGISGDTPAAWAIEKLEGSLLSVVVVLVVNRLWGNSLGSIFWQRGRLGLGLTVGLIAFALMLAVVIPFTTSAFKGQNLTWIRILTWLPWLLMFVLANGFAEETIFRGVLLGRLQPFVGAFAANVATAIPFTLAHAPTTYATDQLLFLGATFLFALAWGWLMQKTQSIWGSVLFHAAMDIPIVAGIFSAV